MYFLESSAFSRKDTESSLFALARSWVARLPFLPDADLPRQTPLEAV